MVVTLIETFSRILLTHKSSLDQNLRILTEPSTQWYKFTISHKFVSSEIELQP